MIGLGTGLDRISATPAYYIAVSDLHKDTADYSLNLATCEISELR